MEETLIELKDIYKIYEMGDEEVRANDGISLTINRGEFVAIWMYPAPANTCWAEKTWGV